MQFKRTNNGRWFALKKVILLVLLQFAVFPALYYSQSHLHYFLGVYVSHWHPLAKGQSSNGSSPLASHKHTLRELLTIHASQGSPSIQNVIENQVFLSLPLEITPPSTETIPLQHIAGPVEARAPPVLSIA